MSNEGIPPPPPPPNDEMIGSYQSPHFRKPKKQPAGKEAVYDVNRQVVKMNGRDVEEFTWGNDFTLLEKPDATAMEVAERIAAMDPRKIHSIGDIFNQNGEILKLAAIAAVDALRSYTLIYNKASKKWVRLPNTKQRMEAAKFVADRSSGKAGTAALPKSGSGGSVDVDMLLKAAGVEDTKGAMEVIATAEQAEADLAKAGLVRREEQVYEEPKPNP